MGTLVITCDAVGQSSLKAAAEEAASAAEEAAAAAAAASEATLIDTLGGYYGIT